MKLSLSLVTLAILLLGSALAQAADKPKTNGTIPPPHADAEKGKPAPMPPVPAASSPVVASLLPPPPLDAAPAQMDPRSGAWRQQWILSPADGLGQVAGGVGDSCGNCRRKTCRLCGTYGRNAWAWCCK